MKSVILIAVMAVVTILLRFLPFLVFRKKTPPYITYLGHRHAGDLLPEGYHAAGTAVWTS